MPGSSGKLIESRTLGLCESPQLELVRLWLVDVYSAREPMLADETCVVVVRGPIMPKLGDHVSWLGETVCFGDCGTRLVKVGECHPAPGLLGDA